MSIEPVTATLTVTGEQEFTAAAFDEFDNPIPELSFDFASDEPAGQVDTDGRFTAGTKAGTYQNAVTVEVTQAAVTKQAIATVTVGPGPLDHVNIDPPSTTVQVTKKQQFTATALDEFDNPIPGLAYVFDSEEEAGGVDIGGLLTAGTKAGRYQDAVTVEVSQGPITKTGAAIVTLAHGPLDRVLLEPSTVALDIGESREFSAEAFDAYGNPIPEAQITWEATPRVGAIADDGLLTAGTSADTVREAVRVTAVLGSGSAESSASVTVQPDPLDSVTLASIAISAGDGRQLQARATDQYGNIVPEVRMTWAVLDSNTGSATETGLFTAGEVEISLTDAVQVQGHPGRDIHCCGGRRRDRPRPAGAGGHRS